MEAVDVLGRIDRLDHLRFVDLLRKGELDEDPVDGVVGVEPRHEVEQFALRGGRGRSIWRESNPASEAAFPCCGHTPATRGLPPRVRR